MNIELIAKETKLVVFSTEDGLLPEIEQARAFVADFEYDLTTDKGRKDITRLAAKVAKLKTTLDGMGKELVSEAKAKCKLVDVNRKKMREELDKLRDIAKQPLVEWEAAQLKIATENVARIKAEELAKEIEDCHEFALLLNEKYDRDLADKKAEEERLIKEQEEKDKADKIAAKEAQEKREAEIKKQAIADEQVKAEANKKRLEQEKQDLILEQERQQKQAKRDLKTEQERAKQASINSQREAKEAEQRRIEAEEKAKQDAKIAKEKAEAEALRLANQVKQDAINAENKRLADIQAERDRIESERVAEENRVAEELRVKLANNAHVSKIRGAAKDSFMALGLDEELSKLIVLAINSGKVANISITY